MSRESASAAASSLTWFNPRHWPLALGMGVLWAGSRLPLSAAQALGRGLGLLAYVVLPSRRRIVLRNLELCFPTSSETWRKNMVRANFVSTGMGLVEGGIAWWRDDTWLASRVQAQGLEHYFAASAQGKGVFVLGAHFTSMELGGRIASMHLPVSTVYKPAKNKMFDAVMLKARGRHYQSLISNDNLRGMLAVLRSGGACWYGADQDFGLEQSVFAPFFGVPTATLTLASKIVERTGAKVLFTYPERLPDAAGYVLHILPVEGFAQGNLEQDAARYNGLIEDVVRRAPQDYFWLHRRFKTRPPGETNPYD